MNRKLVFISHANPEDNEFTLWLAARLSSMGYLVWSDLTELFGAEIFWDDIEDAIRNHAAKVVVVLSRVAQQKDGVLDEINLAVSVERNEGLKRFVVPLRIDDLPFSDVKPNLGRKNIIDFEGGNWTEGLGQLLKVLARDDVPRKQTMSAREISSWIEKFLTGSRKIVKESHSLLSNWFQITALPETLNFLMVPIKNEKVRSYFEPFQYPVYPYQNMLATFASEDDVNQFLPSWFRATTAYRIPLLAILNSEAHSLPQLEWFDASNMLSFLIRSTWDSLMRALGLLQYEMANGRKAWFPAAGYSPDGWTRYSDINDTLRRRRLVGRSKRRKVHWHFAMEAWPFIGREPRIVLKPHVVFTEDGKTPLSSVQQMHQLRRGFCKNWWNPRWRDLILAYTTLITSESESLKLPAGSEQAFIVQRMPISFRSPVSFKDVWGTPIEQDETDSQLDAISEEMDYEWDEELGTDIHEEGENEAPEVDERL
ncbi:MAG: toll/interleukin-1 receptor domain-containing protein [Syntrophaceae bacterium]|nr:toll/interleukin-1 receptor domain-containing protein [Syntrophaceae bacterium]